MTTYSRGNALQSCLPLVMRRTWVPGQRLTSLRSLIILKHDRGNSHISTFYREVRGNLRSFNEMYFSFLVKKNCSGNWIKPQFRHMDCPWVPCRGLNFVTETSHAYPDFSSLFTTHSTRCSTYVKMGKSLPPFDYDADL